MIFVLSGCWKNAESIRKIPNAIKKSTNPTATELKGISNLGKYTLETKFELMSILLLIWEKVLAKNVQTVKPLKTING